MEIQEPLKIEETVEKERMQSKKQYIFKLNNSEYNLQIEFYSEYLNIRLIEIEEDNTISIYIKTNLNIDKEFNIDLNKITEQIDIAFNEEKFQLIKEENNVLIILKLENNKEKIEKKIALKKQELSIKEKVDYIINEIGSVKRKNNEIDEKILKSEKILNDMKLNLQSKEKEKISEIENSLKEVKEAINIQRKENENIYKAFESKMSNLNEEIYEIYKDKLDSVKLKIEEKLPDIKDLYQKFLIRLDDKSIFKDKLLIPQELTKYLKIEKLKKIIISNENNSEEIKSFINNYLIIDFLNSNQKAKNVVLNEFKIFEKYYIKIKKK